ncbi:MAG: GIDE domain-containing protein [Candidatus Micrarchaeota archaeon]
MAESPVVWLAIGFFAGLFIFYWGFKQFARKRLIENTPTSKIRSLAMGLVEVFGSIEAFKETLVSPIMKKNCVWYSFKVEEKRGSGKSSHWATVMSGTRGVPFFVRDDTAAVLVNPEGAQTEFSTDLTASSNVLKEPPEAVKAFLKEHNYDYKAFFLNKTMRFEEKFVCPGDSVYVMGTAGDNPFVEEATAVKGVEDAMIAKAKNAPFFIYDKPEKQILASLAWKSWGGILGGAVLSLACLAFLLVALGVW